MNWPLEIPLGEARLLLPAPGGYVLEPAPGQDTVDRLLRAARVVLGDGAVGWAPANGGLLSNLAAWENLLLATQWHAPASLPSLEGRISAWCARLGYDAEGARHLLSRPPARLDEDEQRLVGWLRLLLSRPRLVLLEGEALPGGTPGRLLQALVAEELPAAALLVIDEYVPAGFAPVSLLYPEAP